MVKACYPHHYLQGNRVSSGTMALEPGMLLLCAGSPGGELYGRNLQRSCTWRRKALMLMTVC